MIRVMQVVPQFAVGGGERVAMQLLLNLDSSEFKAAALCLQARPDSEMVRRLEGAGVNVVYLGKRPGIDPVTMRKVFAAVRRFRPDILHSHNYSLPYLLPALVGHTVKAAIHTIHSLAEYDAQGFQRRLTRFAFRRLNVTPVAISEAVGRSIRRVYGVDAPLVPNGIPIEEYRRNAGAGSKWRQANGIRNDDILFVNVSRLWKVKNHRLFLEAFAEVSRRLPSARCLIVGDGPIRVEIETQIAALSLAGRVGLLGDRNDIPEILAAADLFVLSSDCEGSPLCIMEAMAAGKPVVATAVGGIPELVTRACGILVPKGDAAAMSLGMMKLGSDRELRSRMGAAARASAERHFGVDGMTKKYETLYVSTLESLQSAP